VNARAQPVRTGLHGEGAVPPRALLLALLALAVPVSGALLFPEALGEFAALLWLTLLLPGFLLAYYRGWQGAATALAAGMAALALTQAGAAWMGVTVPDTLLGVVVAYLVLSMGQGWLANRLRKESQAAERDVLTGLPDRQGAAGRLAGAFERARSGTPLSVVLFDLDRFSTFNQKRGREAGDEALRTFGRILAHHAGRQDQASRIGGEEFLLVLPGKSGEEARAVAERVRASFRSGSDAVMPLSTSAGIAQYHPSMATADELLAAADHALYRAKHSGRDAVSLFSEEASPAAPALSTPPPDQGVEAGASGGNGDSLAARRPPTLPRDPAEMGRTLPSTIVLPQSPALEGRRVLVVEDDPRVRLLLSTFLRREGFSVTEASTAAAGLWALATEHDVVVTDIHLPDASGNDLVAAVKSRWPATQVVVLTGARDAEVAAEALNAGADRYLFKPVALAELRTHLVNALQRRDSLLDEGRERRRLTREARERADQAREAILRGARALVRAVEVRDPYTKGHSDRVAAYAIELARGLRGAQEIDVQSLRLACELHDVGKIGVPDAILNKEAGLTREEFAEVRLHPVVGRRILEPLFDDETVLAVVSWHHERWDGTCYPDGLAGEAIPLVARITSIADTLDAMTSRRAYRSALPWDMAVAEVRVNLGRQFDPSLLRVFEEALPRMTALAAESQGTEPAWTEDDGA
jgi:putative two-component system response regulator